MSSWLWERGKSPYDLFLSNTEENGKCFIWNYPEKVLSGRQKMSRRTVYGNILALTDVLCISDQAGRVGKAIKWSGCMKSCFPRGFILRLCEKKKVVAPYMITKMASIIHICCISNHIVTYCHTTLFQRVL